MKIYSHSIPLQSSKKRQALNIHSHVKAAVEKSGCREGLCLIFSPDSDSAIVIMQNDSEVLEETDRRISELGASRGSQGENMELNSADQFQALQLGQQVTLPVSDGRLDIGHTEAVFFVELNGIRPRRAVIKILGE